HQAEKAGQMVPAKAVSEIQHRENREDNQGYHFLHDFQLCRGECAAVPCITPAIRWDLKTVFKQGDSPTSKNRYPEGARTEFKVSIPGKGHKQIGNNQEDDSPHSFNSVRRVLNRNISRA